MMIFLVAKPSHVGADVDNLAYSLHHPTVCSHQRDGQSFLIGSASSYHAVVGGDVFPGNAKPLGLYILCGVDCSSACKTESHLKSPPLPRACLSDVRVIIVICVYPC
jgi:hypothetical protein